jgi:hypothetical protein
MKSPLRRTAAAGLAGQHRNLTGICAPVYASMALIVLMRLSVSVSSLGSSGQGTESPGFRWTKRLWPSPRSSAAATLASSAVPAAAMINRAWPAGDPGTWGRTVPRRLFSFAPAAEDEEAHLGISNPLLQIPEDGSLTYAQNPPAGCKNTVITAASLGPRGMCRSSRLMASGGVSRADRASGRDLRHRETVGSSDGGTLSGHRGADLAVASSIKRPPTGR